MAFILNPNFCTKKDLYLAIDAVRSERGIPNNKNNPSFYNDCANYDDIKLLTCDLQDRELRGFSVVSKNAIVLNSLRTETERNFDCAHEFAHLSFHKNVNHKTFKCHDYNNPDINPYLEWQANETAAELLIPYRKFIPEFIDDFRKCSDFCEYWNLVDCYAYEYEVSRLVMEYRIESLRYELHQYECGKCINEIEFLSKRKREERGLMIQSYHDRFDPYDMQKVL